MIAWMVRDAVVSIPASERVVCPGEPVGSVEPRLAQYREEPVSGGGGYVTTNKYR
jgi:hypothetical protein